MSLPATSPRDGTVMAAALLVGPLVGAALFTVPWVAFGLFVSVLTAGGADEAVRAVASFLGLAAMAILFGYLIGAIPAVLAGMVYAGMRRALGERAVVAALSALMVGLPIAVWFGVSGNGLFGFCLVIAHFVLTAVLTWSVVTARWRASRP